MAIPVLTTLFLLGCAPQYQIDNPYAGGDWKPTTRATANFHTHTTQSDGRFVPSDAIDLYHAHVYEVLAISDHNRVTYPWTELTELTPSIGAVKRMAQGELESKDLTYENRDPEQLGMVALQANEMSRHHHMGSFFHAHPGTTVIASSLTEKLNIAKFLKQWHGSDTWPDGRLIDDIIEVR